MLLYCKWGNWWWVSLLSCTVARCFLYDCNFFPTQKRQVSDYMICFAFWFNLFIWIPSFVLFTFIPKSQWSFPHLQYNKKLDYLLIGIWISFIINVFPLITCRILKVTQSSLWNTYIRPGNYVLPKYVLLVHTHHWWLIDVFAHLQARTEGGDGSQVYWTRFFVSTSAIVIMVVVYAMNILGTTHILFACHNYDIHTLDYSQTVSL